MRAAESRSTDDGARTRAYESARLGLAALFCAVLFAATAATANEPAPGAEAVIAPGREELIAEMLGGGLTLPGECELTGGQIDGGVITATYRCADGDVTFELRHPSRAPAAARRTSQFGIGVRNGSPPPGLADAVESRIRSREAAFEWTWLPPAVRSSQPSSPRTIPLALAGALVVAVFVWVLRRRARGRHSGRSWVPALWFEALRRLARKLTSGLKPLLRDKRFWAVGAIFVLSAIARCWLSIIDRESTSQHLEVVEMIRAGGWLPPASSACMNCSHAKLYHYVLAFALELIPVDRMVLGNLLNFVAGTALLVLLFAFSRSARWSPPVRILAIAFMSFNAAFIGIFSISTNDGFCILFSSLAIFFLDRFFAESKLGQAIVATVFVIFAALSKASGWAIFAAGAAVLCVKLFTAAPRRRKNYAASTAVFVLGFLAVVPFTNPYAHNIVHAHTPFVNDAFDAPFMKMEVPRPPVAWVFQDLFTFRFFELLRVPYNDTFGSGPYPLHRESLWSQLYAKTFFLRFDQGKWTNWDHQLISFGRLCLVLGVLPFVALLVGSAELLRSVWRGVSVHGVRWFAEDREWHHAVFAGALLAAMIALVIRYHRLWILFTWMRPHYLLPAILPFYKLFLDGLEVLWQRRPRLVTGWMLAMIAASIIDIGWLIHDLVGS